MGNENTKKLEEMLKEYAQKNAAAFHMPGHKRVLDPLFDGAAGSPYGIDITEIEGFDDLHAPEGILKAEQAHAAELYGAKSAYFSVNGSTGAILCGMAAAVAMIRKMRMEEDRPVRLLMERSCHRAVYHAAELLQLEVSYIEDGEMPAKMAEERFLVDLIVLTSPSYEGIIKDIAGFARKAKGHHALLYVDAAHGAHLGFHQGFPTSAILQGADLVNVSTHKTLPALTQTAILFNASGRVPDQLIRHYFDIFISSSPSYVLLSSMTAALHLLSEKKAELFDAYYEKLMRLRVALAAKEEVHLVGDPEGILSVEEYPSYPAGVVLDPGKLLLQAKSDSAAKELASRLRAAGIECEWVKGAYLLLMTSFADTEEMYARLLGAIS